MNLYKKVNEPLYKTDVCDMETLTDGQTNMTFIISMEKTMDSILTNMGHDINKGW